MIVPVGGAGAAVRGALRRLKSLARTHVWWRGIDQQIEAMFNSCSSCQSGVSKSPLTTAEKFLGCHVAR